MNRCLGRCGPAPAGIPDAVANEAKRSVCPHYWYTDLLPAREGRPRYSQAERSSNGWSSCVGYKLFEEICQLDDGLLAIQLDARSSSKEWLDLDDITTNFGLFFWSASIGIIGTRGDAPEKHVDGNGK